MPERSPARRAGPSRPPLCPSRPTRTNTSAKTVAPGNCACFVGPRQDETKGGTSDELARTTPHTPSTQHMAPPLAAAGRRQRDANGARRRGATPAHSGYYWRGQSWLFGGQHRRFQPGMLASRSPQLVGALRGQPRHQASSLHGPRVLTATTNTIEDHGLARTDGNAVLTWARPDAEAELFALIVQAIDTPAASQTPDQQNAVAWVQAVEQRQAEVAAQDAGLEYVKWAGLDQSDLLVAHWRQCRARATSSRSSPAARRSPYGTGVRAATARTSHHHRTNRSTPPRRPVRPTAAVSAAS